MYAKMLEGHCISNRKEIAVELMEGLSWVWAQPMKDDVICNIVFHLLNPYPEWSLHWADILSNFIYLF